MCVHLFSISAIDIFLVQRHISAQDGSSCNIQFSGKERQWFGCMITIAICPHIEIQTFFTVTCPYDKQKFYYHAVEVGCTDHLELRLGNQQVGLLECYGNSSDL